VSAGLVVGATGGIGAACARRLEGAAERLVITARRRDALDELAHELNAVAVPADLASATGRDAIAAAVEEGLAWVVLAHGMPLRKPLAEADEDEIASLFMTNLVAPTLLLRRLLDLEWDDGANVVVVGSISAVRALPRRAVYGASKAGLEQLAKTLAAELAPRGIRVNVVSPGVIETPFLGDDRSTLESWVRARVPQRRAGDADEVARVVAFVVRESPPYLNGARIVVDGGTEALA
jgi:NAD(P)-dependent dehydrogenase (short-subunit alcohol dehydrogenase family)